jgi:DNA-binding response OmpR family regulator
MDTNESSTVLLFTRDLLFSSRVMSEAKRQNLGLSMPGDPDSLLRETRQSGVGLVLLDLANPGCNPSELVPPIRRQLGERGVIIAFGPHVDERGLQAAREAGCDLVLTRGQFNRQMAEVLARYQRGAVGSVGETQT